LRKRSQVIIVGGGPVGVGLAVDLGLRGISCTLVERRVGMHKIPKGQNLAQRMLEHFYFWGCVDELRAQRLLPPEVPVSGVTAYKSLMSEYWHAFVGREAVNEFYFQKNDRLPQYLLENVLRRKMASLPLVEAHFVCAAGTPGSIGLGMEAMVAGPIVFSGNLARSTAAACGTTALAIAWWPPALPTSAKNRRTNSPAFFE
jgi:hypothetical protein